jgi:hypothetical protein
MKIQEFRKYVSMFGWHCLVFIHYRNHLLYPVNFTDVLIADIYDESNDRFIINCDKNPYAYEIRVHRLIECSKNYSSSWEVYFQYKNHDPVQVTSVFFDQEINAVVVA